MIETILVATDGSEAAGDAEAFAIALASRLRARLEGLVVLEDRFMQPRRDAGLGVTATLPAPAEMRASLHIHGTASSVMDSVFVCRHRDARRLARRAGPGLMRHWLERDREALAEGGVGVSRGDLRCLALGHLARVAAGRLADGWRARDPVAAKLPAVHSELDRLTERCDVAGLADELATRRR